MVFVCVSNNRAGAVSQLLISIKINGTLLIPIDHVDYIKQVLLAWPDGQ